MFVYKMYPTFRQSFVYILYTKFSWHSSFDFTYKLYTKASRNMVYILYTFCIHQLYTSCTIFVYKMYTQFPCRRLFWAPIPVKRYQNTSGFVGVNYKIRSYQKAIDTPKLLNKGLSSSVPLGTLLQQEQ